VRGVVERLVPTPLGDAKLIVSPADDPVATLVLGHGAGGGSQARDLAALATALPAAGVTVVRIEQPWRVAGKRVAPRPAVLDEGWLGAMSSVDVVGPLVVGGRSAGARVACRTAARLAAAGVVCCAFPLHPPGRPERSRFDELAGAGVPVLVVQGTRDSFGRPSEFPGGAYQMVSIEAADHSMAVPKGHEQKQALNALVGAVVAWLGNALGVWVR
jgi:uncharacterized protein